MAKTAKKMMPLSFTQPSNTLKHILFVCAREVSGFYRQTSPVIDDIADMLLSTVVECIEKQSKLLRRLATEH